MKITSVVFWQSFYNPIFSFQVWFSWSRWFWGWKTQHPCHGYEPTWIPTGTRLCSQRTKSRWFLEGFLRAQASHVSATVRRTKKHGLEITCRGQTAWEFIILSRIVQQEKWIDYARVSMIWDMGKKRMYIHCTLHWRIWWTSNWWQGPKLSNGSTGTAWPQSQYGTLPRQCLSWCSNQDHVLALAETCWLGPSVCTP